MAFPYSISVLDNFTGANGDPLGANWSNMGGFTEPMEINANRARTATAGFGSKYWNPTTFGPDMAVYLTVQTMADTSKYIYLAVRGAGAARTHYELLIVDGTWQLYRQVAGTGTTVGASASQTISSGGLIGLDAVGTTITGYYSSNGGSSWNTIVSGTDGTHAGAGYAGFLAEGNSNFFDDFAAGNAAVVAAPVAEFSGTPLSGAAPLSVSFTDLSTNTPTGWLYEYSADGGANWVAFTNSTQQNPTQVFN